MRIHIPNEEFNEACNPLFIGDATYRAMLPQKSPPPIFLPKEACTNKSEIGKFYFPLGKPHFSNEEVEERIKMAFSDSGKDELTMSEMGPVAKACNCPFFWKAALFNASRSSNHVKTVTSSDVINMWKRITSSCHDDASRFVAMLAKSGNSFLEFDDFQILLQDVVSSHQGLAFLLHAPQFHTRYMNTVIARIFYTVNRSWSGRINIRELRKSSFLNVLASLHGNDDINTETQYFSYEHFYVIYCKFWELDHDHDLVINKRELSMHEQGVISSRIIERALSGAVTRWDGSDHFSQEMSYVDFVWFLLSEEDKLSATSIEYWFRCMDLDGDGRISMYEMEYFYMEQINKLKLLNIKPIPFKNCLCQLLDLVKPANGSYVTLKDLKRCKMADVYFNAFINIEKYLHNETNNSSAKLKAANAFGRVPSAWERYARTEYDFLVDGEDDEEEDDDDEDATR